MIKLSVCIPVYNFDVRDLVYGLKKEIESQNLSAEIILIDDFSDSLFFSLNSEIQNIASDYILLDENNGRSKIRNLFLNYAQGEYLLFLDCDGKLIDKNFLKNYLDFLSENPVSDVLYGGRKVPAETPDQKHLLRWKFAVERENLSVEKRKSHPYLSFQTNNFVIRKNVLDKIPFNISYSNYGYEDLLFAMDLKSENILIHHIENPVLNNDVETNERYLEKVKESVSSVASMLKKTAVRNRISDIKLVKAFEKLNFFPLHYLIVFLFIISEKFLEKSLLKGCKNLRYLDLFKLGLLFKLMKS
ncbi:MULTISPECIES: glycosyltransferase family 2 protein [unclassified Chryseobacterium]|uniref:glycosyltransferase family 2 protein n=1 Tax=unclassified Chryseobacterium TaxID=2593645 RepID=UPI000AFA22B8|nr:MULTISPECIES: glycosyltransferase [unclassified Chryseobacterium]